MDNKSSWIHSHPKPSRLWVAPESSWTGYASIGDYPSDDAQQEYEFVDADILAQTVAANAALVKRLEEARGVIEFYAAERTYETQYERLPCECCTDIFEPINEDKGERARAFLAGGE